MSISNQRGNVLLFVIAGIAMIASIAMGMFYMTSTSSLGQAGGSGMNRAYYLALAGKDYATANWSNMASWNNSESSLSNTESFHLSSSGGIITSTGIVNKNTPFEAKKTIKASQPSPVKEHFFEPFEDLTKWATGAVAGEVGSHQISADKALDVTSAPIDAFGSGSGKWSFLQLKTGTGVGNAVDFSPAWLDAGRCLSHDLQVKIKNSELYYMAGLNFKIDNTDNEFYGVSFLRAKESRSWSPSGWSDWSDNDNIPSELKPTAIPYTPDFLSLNRYSQPAIVLWKRQGGTFTWLAYKLLVSTDYVVDGSNNKLVAWSNLQVRLNEVYGFSAGRPDLLLNGAIVVGQNGSGRIRGTPIMTSGTDGTLTLANVSGYFANGDLLSVNGVPAATMGTKTNLIRVYYGDAVATVPDTSNTFPTDNNRKRSPRTEIHWPVDNVSDWKAENDYMTLVQLWDGFQAGASILGGSGTEANAIIKDNSLPTPSYPDVNIDHSGIALHAAGNNATSTYFDDFAVQY